MAGEYNHIHPGGMMFGDANTNDANLIEEQRKEHEQRLALIRKEAQLLQRTNEEIHSKVPSINDAPAQVRFAIYGMERPRYDAPIDEMLWYCTELIGRVPATSRGEAWERNRTFADLTARGSGSVNDETLRKNIMDFIFRLESMISTADPHATQGMTGIMAITTSTRYEKLDQNIRNLPLPNAPGLFDGILNKIRGKS
jgi:hypothetical protein